MIALHPTLTPGVARVHRDLCSQSGLAAVRRA